MSDPSWDGERGGFDDIEYTIEEAKFGFDERYDAAVGRNVASFITHGTAVLSDGNQFPASKQRWGIGNKFDPVDNGKRAVHESGDETKQFHYQSGYMNFVRAARACGAKEIIEARCQGDPLNLRNADIWVGLRFRLQRQPVGKFTDDKTGEERDYSLLLPTEFLGEAGASAVSASTEVTAAPAQTNSNGSLEDLARDTENKMDFLDKAVRGQGADIAEAEQVWDRVNS